MDEILAAAQKAAKDAKRAALLTGLAAAVAVVVLAIDQTIKRQLLEQTERARAILAVAERTAEVRGGSETAGEARIAAGAGVDGGSSVGDDATAGAVLAETPDPAEPAPRRRAPRTPGRARGNG